jgi:hypothetical protein
MREIPRHIIERDKEGVESLTYYGVPVTELDRDGLLAALNQTAKQARSRKQEQADYFLSGGLTGRR